MKNLLVTLSFALLTLPPVQSASAQAYPSKPIRLLVPFPGGGSNDIIGRVIGHKLPGAFGQQIVAGNRGGASGILAAELAAGAHRDGYTVLFGGVGGPPHLTAELLKRMSCPQRGSSKSTMGVACSVQWSASHES